MTARETLIGKKILDALHALDSGQAHTLAIHADVGGYTLCSGTEFDAVMAELSTRRYVVGIKSKHRGMLWNISDAGEAARLEM